MLSVENCLNFEVAKAHPVGLFGWTYKQKDGDEYSWQCVSNVSIIHTVHKQIILNEIYKEM